MSEELEATQKIILGRSKSELEEIGDEAAIFIGKKYTKVGIHYFLTNPVYLDVNKPHAILICGKRGSGKSYTAGVFAEAITMLDKKTANRIAPILFDTMGIYWTMKYPNIEQKKLLEKWDLEPRSLADRVVIFVPAGLKEELEKFGIKADKEIKLQISDISGEEWLTLMDLDINTELGAFIAWLINKMRENYDKFDFNDIYSEIEKQNVPSYLKWAAINKFSYFESLGLFFEEGTDIKEFINPGKASVIDISYYVYLPGGNQVRALVISLLCRKFFAMRIKERKYEEIKYIEYLTTLGLSEIEFREPIIWIVIDEAHEFLPNDKKTLATDILVQILREGRQPGISTVLITQQPGKIHTDAITQSDIIISHLLTAKVDLDALKNAMQTYTSESIEKMMLMLPKRKGAALVLDDKQEKVYQIQIRPRITWHGGSEPRVIIK